MPIFQEGIPCLKLPDGRSISGDLAIARYIARSSSAAASTAVALLGGEDPVEAGVVDQWLDLSQTRVLVELASTLDAHLAPRYSIIYTVEGIAICLCLFTPAIENGVGGETALPQCGGVLSLQFILLAVA